MKDLAISLLVVVGLIMFGMIGALIVRGFSLPEGCPFFKQLDEEGCIEWYLDKDNNRKWKLKCPCSHESTSTEK